MVRVAAKAAATTMATELVLDLSPMACYREIEVLLAPCYSKHQAAEEDAGLSGTRHISRRQMRSNVVLHRPRAASLYSDKPEYQPRSTGDRIDPPPFRMHLVQRDQQIEVDCSQRKRKY